MTTPADGFYEALVTLDTGGEIKTAVRVLGGKVLTVHPYELLPSACRDFQPMSNATAAEFWPREIGALCDQLAARVKRLEEAGDAMASCLLFDYSENLIHVQQWTKAKGQP